MTDLETTTLREQMKAMTQSVYWLCLLHGLESDELDTIKNTIDLLLSRMQNLMKELYQ